MTKLADVVDCVSDQCLPAGARTPVYVGLEHIDSGALWLMRHGSPIEVHSAKGVFRKGDILYGKLRPYLDKAVLAKGDGICSTDILIFRPKGDACGAYLAAVLHSRAFREHAVSTTRGVNHPRTSWSALGSFEWEAPSRPEQERIAALLWKVQKAVEIQDKLVRTARELKAAAMRSLFIRGLRGEPLKETDVGLVPSSWEVKALREVAVVKGGKRLPKGNALTRNPTAHPYIRVTDFHDNTVDMTGLMYVPDDVHPAIERYIIRATDIYISIAGTIGLVGVVPMALDGANLTENAARIIASSVSQTFLMRFLASPAGQGQIASFTSKNAQPKLALTRIEDIKVPVPASVVEQEQLAQMFETVDKKIALHEKKRDALQDLFQALLHQLMTARIRVHDLDIDTSEVAG